MQYPYFYEKDLGPLRDVVETTGIVVGNAFNKYDSKNPIVNRLMLGFRTSLTDLVETVHPNCIHEVGCGEGFWVNEWNSVGIQARGTDFSSKVIKIAQENAFESKLSPDLFDVRSIYELDPEIDRADLVVCCEVLEHLDNPTAALEMLGTVASPYLIVSVPREPLWSLMNMARGKYLSNFGNSPGHIQRWSQRRFVQLVAQFFDIQELRAPTPWTMLLCRNNRQQQ